MKIRCKKKNASAGNTLIAVLMVLVVVSIIGAGVVTLSVQATATSAEENRQLQASFTARSAVQAAISSIQSKTGADITAYVGKTGTGTMPGVDSSFSLTIQYVGDDLTTVSSAPTHLLLITGTGYYRGTSSKVSAYLKNSDTGGSSGSASGGTAAANPNDNIFYVADGSASGFTANTAGSMASGGDMTVSGGTITGNLLVKGTFNLGTSSPAVGLKKGADNIAVTAGGNVNLHGGSVNGSIISGGAVTMDNSGITVYGDIYAAGDVTISGGHVAGSIYTNGKVTIQNAGVIVDGNITAGGYVTVTSPTIAGSVTTSDGMLVDWGGGSIGGDLKASKGIEIRGCTMAKNVYTNGNLTLKGGEIKGSAYAASYSPQGGRLDGSLQSPGSFSVPAMQTITVSYSPPVVNPVAAPSRSDMPTLYNPVRVNSTGGEYVISGSGTLVGNDDASKDFSVSSYGWNGMIVIDASAGDIYLRVNKSFTLSQAIAFKVRDTSGKHHVFIYLTDACGSLNLSGGNYLGMEDTTKVPSLYIFGNKQTVSLNYSSLYGYVFVPNGTFSTTSSTDPYNNNGIHCNYLLYGNILAKNIVTQWKNNAVSYLFTKPDLTLAQFTGMTSGGTLQIAGTSADTGASSGGAGSGGADTAAYADGGSVWGVLKWVK